MSHPLRVFVSLSMAYASECAMLSGLTPVIYVERVSHDPNIKLQAGPDPEVILRFYCRINSLLNLHQ